MISNVIAILAILCSLYCLQRTNTVSKQIANKSLQQDIFKSIFFDFMITTLPERILLPLEMKSGMIHVSAEDVETVIMDILKRAKPYRYFNEQFYQEFYVAMSDLEEYIFVLIREQVSGSLTDSLYEKISCKIDVLCERVYSIMKKEFMC